jgi:hypothetical protein
MPTPETPITIVVDPSKIPPPNRASNASTIDDDEVRSGTAEHPFDVGENHRVAAQKPVIPEPPQFPRLRHSGLTEGRCLVAETA